MAIVSSNRPHSETPPRPDTPPLLVTFVPGGGRSSEVPSIRTSGRAFGWSARVDERYPAGPRAMGRERQRLRTTACMSKFQFTTARSPGCTRPLPGHHIVGQVVQGLVAGLAIAGNCYRSLVRELSCQQLATPSGAATMSPTLATSPSTATQSDSTTPLLTRARAVHVDSTPPPPRLARETLPSRFPFVEPQPRVFQQQRLRISANQPVSVRPDFAGTRQFPWIAKVMKHAWRPPRDVSSKRTSRRVHQRISDPGPHHNGSSGLECKFRKDLTVAGRACQTTAWSRASPCITSHSGGVP